MTNRWQRWFLSTCALTAACVPSGDDPKASATEGVSSSTGSTTSGLTASDGASMDATGSSSTSGATSAPTTAPSTSSEDTDTGTDTQATFGTSVPTTSTTGSAGSVCGDGELDFDEECDDGDQNGDNASCKADCTIAFCGDEETLLGKEACDAGDKNGDGSYGGCTDLCQLGPHCGDKIHQPAHEECDALDPELEDGSQCIGCAWDANLLFVSSQPYNGALGGVAGADQACQDLAEAAMLPSTGRFRAWLSDDDSSPLTRFGPPLEGAFILPNGTEVAASWAALISNADLSAMIDVNELKAHVSKPPRAWSNTSSTGHSLESFDCEAWMVGDDSAKGSYGSTEAQDGLWTTASEERCYRFNRLYCVATAE